MSAPTLSSRDLQVRLAVYHYILEHTTAPAPATLAAQLGLALPAVRQSLARLHQQHLLVLEPDGHSIRMAHPFSAIPTGYPVTVGQQRFWANCAWDSLGIPAVLHRDARIDTTFTYSGEPTSYAAAAGALVAPDGGVVHFPLPFRHWYDDLIRTCATMLLFRSDAAVDAWCAATGEPRGDTVPLAQVWALSLEWYAPRLDPTYQGRTPAQAVAVFDRAGLRSSFWKA
jgi:hypothetical protein